MTEIQTAEPTHQLSLKKKLLFSGIVVMICLVLGFAFLEAYVRLTKPYVDLYAITGRQAGLSPMASWAAVDAFCAYRGRPGEYASAGEGTENLKRQGVSCT